MFAGHRRMGLSNLPRNDLLLVLSCPHWRVNRQHRQDSIMPHRNFQYETLSDSNSLCNNQARLYRWALAQSLATDGDSSYFYMETVLWGSYGSPVNLIRTGSPKRYGKDSIGHSQTILIPCTSAFPNLFIWSNWNETTIYRIVV